MATCPNCHTDNADGANLCISCGRTLAGTSWWKRLWSRPSSDPSSRYVRSGWAYLEHDQTQEALRSFDEAIRLNPQSSSAYRGRAFGYIMQQRFEDAVRDLDQAIRIDPQDAASYADRGYAHREAGQPQRAVQDYSEAIRLKPKNPEAHFGRALAYAQLGKDLESEEDATRAQGQGADFRRLRDEIARVKRLR